MEYLSCLWRLVSDNSSELIALSALFLAIWQGVVSRNHNSLSVRPYLIFHVNNQCEEPQLSVELENVGVGPAVINHYSVLLDGVDQDLSKNSAFVEIAKQLNIPDKTYGGGKVYSQGEAIPAGGNAVIFKVITKHGKDEGFDGENADNELGRIQIVIKYESLYGASFTVKLHAT